MKMHFENFKDTIRDAVQFIEDRYEKKTRLSISDYKYFGGPGLKTVNFSQIVCLAAHTDVCLVTAAYNFYKQRTECTKHPAVFTTMPKQYLALRMIAEHSGVPLRRLITGNLRSRDWHLIVRSIGSIFYLPLIVNNNFKSVEDIIRQVHHFVRFREKGLGPVIIDSFQNIAGKSEKDVKKSIGKLRTLSKISVPVVLTMNVECDPKDLYNWDAVPDMQFHAVKKNVDWMLFLNSRVKKNEGRGKHTCEQIDMKLDTK